MALDAELHADEEAVLLDEGSRQGDLWGINLYPDLTEAQFVEFDSPTAAAEWRARPARQDPGDRR